MVTLIKVVFMCLDFCGTPSVQYDSYLDSFECKLVDERHVEGQEIGVSCCIVLWSLLENYNF